MTRTIRTRTERLEVGHLPPEGPTMTVLIETGYADVFRELVAKAPQVTGPIAIVPVWIGNGPAPAA